MAKLPRISDAEWEVMQVIWDEHPIYASEVVERLQPTTDWSARTIKTMLGRLVAKAALDFQQDGNRYLYRPTVTRDRCLAHASQSFLERVFGGCPRSLLTHFVRNVDLSQAELDELKQVLKEKSSR